MNVLAAENEKLPSPLYVTKGGTVVMLIRKTRTMGDAVVMFKPSEPVVAQELATVVEVLLLDLKPFHGTITMEVE